MKTTRRPSRPQLWETRWMPIESMQNKVRPAVVVGIEGDTLTVLPLSSQPVAHRVQKGFWFVDRMAFAATNRLFEMQASQFRGPQEQLDKQQKQALKRELALG